MIEFRLKTDHAVLFGRQVIECWHNGRFIASITSDDEAGVRVMSKHAMTVAMDPAPAGARRILPNFPDMIVVIIDPTQPAPHRGPR